MGFIGVRAELHRSRTLASGTFTGAGVGLDRIGIGVVESSLLAQLVQPFGRSLFLPFERLFTCVGADPVVLDDAVVTQGRDQQAALGVVGGLADRVLARDFQLRQDIRCCQHGIPAGLVQIGIGPRVQDFALLIEELVLQLGRARAVGAVGLVPIFGPELFAGLQRPERGARAKGFVGDVEVLRRRGAAAAGLRVVWEGSGICSWA